MQAGSVPCDQKFSCQWNLSFFKAVLPNRLPFYLGSLLHIISSLSSHFRSWDNPENFGIYSQLDRKSKTCFFTFLIAYVCWIEWDKILISQFSSPNFRYFADQTILVCKIPEFGRWKLWDPMKMNFDNFQIQNWISQTVLKK